MRRVFLVILCLIVVSPVFGVILADMVGYREPLDLVAEELGLPDLTERLNWTPLLDYTVPGLPAELGYIVSGFIGVALILGLGFIVERIVLGGRRREGTQGSSEDS